jgi:hypothetical protein
MLLTSTLVVSLAGCTEETPQPADKGNSPSAEQSQTQQGPDPERLPIAYEDDGRTLRICSDWESLGDDLQHGMAARAIVESQAGPPTEAKVAAVRRSIDQDCPDDPQDVLWNVAVRGALSL